MSTTIDLDEIPGPSGLPLVGNAFDIDADHPIEGFMAMAEEYGPIFKLSVPGGTRLIVSGPDLVEEICDDARFDKQVGGGLADLRKGAADTGLFTSETDDPLWHRAHNILMAPFSLQAMRDYMPQDGRHRRPADGQVGPAQPGRRGRRPRRHDPPDPGHHRAVRVRVPVQLLLPRHAAPVRAGDGPHPRRVPGPGTAAADPDPAEDPGAAAGGGGPGVHERPGRPAHRRAAGPGRGRGHHRPARPDAHRRRPPVRRRAARRQHPRAVHHLPGRRPRDHLGPAVLRPLLPAQEPRPSSSGRAPRWTRCWATRPAPTFEQVHRLTYVRQVLDESLRLWPTAPGFTRYPFEDTVIGGRYAIPANTTITVLTPALHRATSVWGPDARGVQPRAHGPRTAGSGATERSTSRSAPGSAPASAGSSRCRRRRWCSGCSSSASTSSTTSTTSWSPRPRSPSSPPTSASRSGRGPDVHINRGGPAEPAADRAPRRPAPHRLRRAGRCWCPGTGPG